MDNKNNMLSLCVVVNVALPMVAAFFIIEKQAIIGLLLCALLFYQIYYLYVYFLPTFSLFFLLCVMCAYITYFSKQATNGKQEQLKSHGEKSNILNVLFLRFYNMKWKIKCLLLFYK